MIDSDGGSTGVTGGFPITPEAWSKLQQFDPASFETAAKAANELKQSISKAGDMTSDPWSVRDVEA